jgi:hypothetical protein
LAIGDGIMPIIIKTRLLALLRIGAITIFPFILIQPKLADDEEVLHHEHIHWYQQLRWLLVGGVIGVTAACLLYPYSDWFLFLMGIGLFAWYFLYLLVLPVGWNYFRYKWEREAYKTANKLTDEEVKERLKKHPYHLWWM